MKFKDLTKETLNRLGERLKRNIEARVDRQVPSPRNNPDRRRLHRTGRLLRSINVTFDQMPSDTWALNIHYENYGDFTLFGTGTYELNARDVGLFGMRFNGYRRGKGGIRPQGWLSLYGDRPVYEAIVEAELNMTLETFLNNTITGFSKGKQVGTR